MLICVFFVFVLFFLFLFVSLFICVKVSYFAFTVFPLCYRLVVNGSAIDCRKRLVSEMIYYVSSGRLNRTHSVTPSPSNRLTKSSLGFV